MGNRHSSRPETAIVQDSAAGENRNKGRTKDFAASYQQHNGFAKNVKGGESSKKRGFLARLFFKSSHDDGETGVDHATLAQTVPPPVGGEMPVGIINGEGATLLRDRPALRLDSRLICKYEVLSIIGKGSFSQVLRVKDRTTNQFYAVKLVAIQNSDFAAVNNELNILSRVQHPFVIRLEEVFRGATKLFIVLELAGGGEMYDRVVGKGRYTELEARVAMRMLLNGLTYLHSLKITHRDLKPENILYSDSTPDARLLITDFGLAHQCKGTEEKYVMHETCGTPEYIAPEILLRIPYSEKVDLWACGVICYILMSGIMPFDDDVRSRLYTQIITANYLYYPQYWSGSNMAKEFVDCLLETNPERRLSAEDASRHDWILGERQKLPPHMMSSNSKKTNNRSSSEINNGMQRTKSTRSIKSVTRSDHGHRVDPKEVDKLAKDLQRLAKKQRDEQPYGGYQSTKHYGVF